MTDFDALRLENQLCFPLYAASKEVIKLYRPYLQPLGLTYTQYIVMLVLWQKGKLNVKELGNALYLDSGTLTPLLKSLESKGYVSRKRSDSDERVLCVSLTKKGLALREEAASIPEKLAATVPLTHEEAVTIYRLLYKILDEKDPLA